MTLASTHLEALVDLAERVGKRPRFLLALVSWRVQGRGVVCAGSLQRVEHILDAELEILGQIGNTRRPARLGHQLLAAFLDLQRQFLRAARNVDRPAEVSEVALQLSENRGHGKR